MRILLVVLVLLSCTSLLAGTASALPVSPLSSSSVSSEKPAPSEPGSFDPFLGIGDLNTKAVPVCCCSFGFCEDTPLAPCTGGPGPGICRCSQSGNACVHI